MTQEQFNALVAMIDAMIDKATDDLQSSDQGLNSAMHRTKMISAAQALLVKQPAKEIIPSWGDESQ